MSSMNIFLLRILALIGLLFVMPLIVLSAIFILIEDGFPVLFIQKRLGKNEKIFELYKIRTMYKNTPNLGTHEISKSQYLKTGSILRKLKIDELPQIFNFIRGDLNLVGPRPGLPVQEKLRKYRSINNIFKEFPGITGLAQVLGYDMSNPELLSKIDKLYIDNRSFKLDFLILIATFIKAFRHRLYLKFETALNEIESKENTIC